MLIKAKETKYKGYRFRSRLEARWAIFFDVLGLAWEYEKEGFDLEGVGPYLPDFWIETWRAWLEVKPTAVHHSSPEWNKCRELTNFGPPVILAQGNVGSEQLLLFCQDSGDSSAGWSEWEADWSFDKQGKPQLYVPTRRTLVDNEWNLLGWVTQESVFLPRLQSAYVAARSARFEHGERPR